MGLTKAQAVIWQRARSLGSGDQAIGLSDGACNFLLSTIVHDLKLVKKFAEFKKPPPPFYDKREFAELVIDGPDPKVIFERLVEENSDSDTYFACLAALHKARLKYERILETQPLPTLEQVGPRSLLQYGQLNGKALAGLLFWRKWFFDIDNRAGQETGYLFEPIIAHAIGGTPAQAKSSPVKRHQDNSKGRQVDCIIDRRAYEFKIRVTIAASGQGRWKEELDFPIDCRRSQFKPVLICMDSTPNPKLTALIAAFEKQRGEVYIGEDAWKHLDSVAGPTMANFLEKYVRKPIQDLLRQCGEDLPDIHAKYQAAKIEIRVGNETLNIRRSEVNFEDSESTIAMDGPETSIE